MRLCLVALLLVAGCERHPSGGSFVAPHYPDGAAGLKQLWTDILEAAQHDEREHVHDLMATTFMSDAELTRLLGPRAQPLQPRYHQLLGTLVNRGAVELVANVFDRKFDTIDVLPDENDGQLQAALVEPHPLWSVRVRKAKDARGLRYDGFVYLDGKWRTTNQLGKFVNPPATEIAPGGTAPAGAGKDASTPAKGAAAGAAPKAAAASGATAKEATATGATAKAATATDATAKDAARSSATPKAATATGATATSATATSATAKTATATDAMATSSGSTAKAATASGLTAKAVTASGPTATGAAATGPAAKSAGDRPAVR